jgi:hypothetical protein
VSRRPGRPALALAGSAVLLVTACTPPFLGGDDVDPDEAETALLAQRDDVAGTAADLVAATQEAVGGEVVEKQGGWEGCTSIFPEGYADFQYVANVQLTARPGAPERLVDRLRAAAEASGLEVTGSGDDDVLVRDGDVSARLWDLPRVNTQGDVAIQLVADPCVDVPEDDWRDWMRREDPGPVLGDQPHE